MSKLVGVLVASGCALWISGAAPGQSPHDIGGVGAQGTIGRGTIPEERSPEYDSESMGYAPADRFAPVAAPIAATIVAPASPPVVAPTPAVAAVAPSRPAMPPPPARQPARVRINPYVGFNRSWLHGYWNAVIVDGPASRGSAAGRLVGPGRGLGWGIPAWLIGPMIYRWGYFEYRNPFLDGAIAGGARREAMIADSHPVNISAPPPTEALLDDGLRLFREARAAFRREDYNLALRRADEAMKLIPDAPALHHFRGFTLLALHRYGEAAAVLHAAVAVVPGWDWTTMARLYHNIDTFSRQLRLLETYVAGHPRLASAHFLLAVEYLTTGYSDAALVQLRQVAALRPDDDLTRRLLLELRPTGPGAVLRTSSPGVEPGNLEGTWIARPRPGATITLTVRPHGHIEWTVAEGGDVRPFEGFGFLVDGTLTLTEDADNSMAGQVRWRDGDHFTFKVLETRPEDAGLSFTRSAPTHQKTAHS